MKKKIDPIFALIADHNAKLAAHEKIDAARKKREQELDAKADYQAKAEKRLLSNWNPPLYVGHAYPVSGSKSIRDHVHFRLRDAGGAFGPKMQRKLLALQPFARKEIDQMVKAFQAEHMRRRRAAGLERMHDQWLRSLDVWAKARRRMVSTAPRTPEGAAALADALDAFEYRDSDHMLGTRSLARAVAMCTKQKSISGPKRRRA